MKKRTKLLIAAAAVAAVAGVSAVSFAAWSGSDKTSVPVTGSTGIVNTLGDLTVTPADGTTTSGAGEAIVMKELYPVDQTAANGLPSGGLTYWTFTLSTATGTGTQNVSYKLKGTIANGSDTESTDKGSAALYWTKTQPTSATVAADGTAVSSDEGGAVLTDVANGGTVYVYMVASGTDAMKASISLTFYQV